MKKTKATKFSHISQEELQHSFRPKYIGLERLESEYGISKGKAYPLIEEGHIKVIKLVAKGRSRGRVLVIVDQLEKYLKSLEPVEAA